MTAAVAPANVEFPVEHLTLIYRSADEAGGRWTSKDGIEREIICPDRSTNHGGGEAQ